eukprot:scaffold486_cov148-Skeletonema_dohrnii-CCMP3373.AAC.34
MTEKAKTYQPAVPAATDNDYVLSVTYAPKDFLEEQIPVCAQPDILCFRSHECRVGAMITAPREPHIDLP